jgi:hypothetical protein
VNRFVCLTATLGLALAALPGGAREFRLPTPNRALLEAGGEARYFVGTVGRPWTSGTYGCVRSDGAQFHEGLDIRAVQRDGQGEATDPVFATLDGVVAYINTKPSLSNYGIYLVLRHHTEGLEFYSVYAHLARIQPGLKEGQRVGAGERLGTLGRTANTSQSISRERAHLHFEIAFRLTDRYTAWHQTHLRGTRNDHGEWNGRNLLGIDPAPVLRSAATNRDFSLLRHLRSRRELCRVLLREPSLSWARRCPGLVANNPRAVKEGTAGFEVSLDATGFPFLLIPRAGSEIAGKERFRLLSVNAAEAGRFPCRKIVRQRDGRWELGVNGQSLVSLLAN